MASIIGENLRLNIFGESHGPAIGCVLDGLPAGETIDQKQIAAFLARRSPKSGSGRDESDTPEILSGLYNGYTTGAPLAAVIRNRDARPGDYKALINTPRPSHADYPAGVRFQGYNDPRGGGSFSGRLTAPLCFAGAVCAQILSRRGVSVCGHLLSVGSVSDIPFDPLVTKETLAQVSPDFPCLNRQAAEAMQQTIAAARADGDSVGGVIECAALGLPVGLGDPIYGGVENRLAAVLFGIPGIRGVEFGEGFAAASMRGSDHNDPYTYRDGRVVTETNHAGGVLGGLTTGMPLLVRAAVKPTPSISKIQRTVDLQAGADTALSVTGRHDPCIAPRAVPCVEAAVWFALLDLWR